MRGLEELCQVSSGSVSFPLGACSETTSGVCVLLMRYRLGICNEPLHSPILFRTKSVTFMNHNQGWIFTHTTTC